MNVFKKILLVLMIIIFIFSLAFNIAICSSTNGTLIFKHNDEKMIAMASADRINLTPDYLMLQKDKGIQLVKEAKENGITTTNKYNIYLDKEYNLTASIKVSTKTGKISEQEKKYLKDGKVYDNEGKELNEQIAFLSQISTQLTEINLYQDALLTNVETTNNKAKIDFSFNPFYFIGIKYEISEEDRTITYNYDLKGRLRKITVDYKTGKLENYSINYKNEKVTVPNLTK